MNAGATPTTQLPQHEHALITDLHREFEPRRQDLLRTRRDTARSLQDGAELGQDPATLGIRKDDTWRVQPPPADLVTRRVELATPATFEDAAPVAGSGADVWVADLEDSLVPTWPRLLEAHEAIADYLSEAGQGQRPTLMVRPRGLHLDDVHLDVAAPIVDVGMVVARHSKSLATVGSAPYFYLPKIETHAEAIWWNDLLGAVEEAWSLPIGSIRVSVLLETVHAAYQMEEILHALRMRVTGLTAGRYDYVFSHLRAYAQRPDHVLPDRDSFTMSTRFLRAYTEVLVHTCRRREAQAIGGPVAEVPSGLHDDSSTRAQKRVSRDKAREAREGFGGAWVLHPALVPVARAAFSEVARAVRPTTTAPIHPMRMTDTSSLAGNPTLSGLRRNIRVSLRYLTAWFGGQAAVVIDGHVEDFGTVELARLQIWQWAHHEVLLAEGLTVSQRLVDRLMREEIAMLRRRLPGAQARVEMAEQVLSEAIGASEPPAFLSQIAYEALVGRPADQEADRPAA